MFLFRTFKENLKLHLEDDEKSHEVVIELVNDKKEFSEKMHTGVYILEGSDKVLLDFAKIYLGYPSGRRGEKGIDIVLKVVTPSRKIIYLVGEAKFFTDFGGHQWEQLQDALALLDLKFDNKRLDFKVIPIAILDGVAWIENNQKMHLAVRNLPPDKVALSILILKDFIKCILEEKQPCRTCLALEGNSRYCTR